MRGELIAHNAHMLAAVHVNARIAPVPGAAVVVLLASVLAVTRRAGRSTRQDDELLANTVLVHGVLK